MTDLLGSLQLNIELKYADLKSNADANSRTVGENGRIPLFINDLRAILSQPQEVGELAPDASVASADTSAGAAMQPPACNSEQKAHTYPREIVFCFTQGKV
jgi:hypothetical protein